MNRKDFDKAEKIDDAIRQLERLVEDVTECPDGNLVLGNDNAMIGHVPRFMVKEIKASIIARSTERIERLKLQFNEI